MIKPNLVDECYYYYAPNKTAPVFFSIAFAILAAAHLHKALLYNSFSFTGHHSIACALFAISFTLREYGSYHYDDISIYTSSTMLMQLSP